MTPIYNDLVDNNNDAQDNEIECKQENSMTNKGWVEYSFQNQIKASSL